jgi:hypothetical protein
MVAYMAATTIFLETKQDKCIIDSADPNKDKSGWKLYGGLKQAAEIVALTAVGCVITGSLYALTLAPTLMLTYSICHDCGMSYRLHKDNPKVSKFWKFFQLGDGKWDTKIKEIFQNGLFWFIFKSILVGGAGVAYFSL